MSLLGRGLERRAIDELLFIGSQGPRVIAIIGEPGSGRTSLVDLASALAVDAGRQVLTIAGLREEMNVPLSGLSHLLLPFVEQIGLLSEAHRHALSRPLGLAFESSSFDLVSTGMALLALITLRPDAAPLFVAVDDADYVDAETLSVLAFVAKRMDRRQVVLLLTSEPSGMPTQFERNATRLRIAALGQDDAHILLSRRGFLHDADLRQRIVNQSAGNPLALLETAAAAVLPGVAARPFCEPLPVGPLIEDRVMARVRGLPIETQTRIIDRAVAASYGWERSQAFAMPQGDLAALGPAERAGLVRIDHSGAHFAHPTYWIAIFHATRFSARVEAHHRVAQAFADQPSRRAWHLGHAAVEPDESVARLLDESANEIGRQLGRLEKALAFERAAELSSDADARAIRFLSAARVAAPTGKFDWVDELASRAMISVRDPELRVKILTMSAWVAAARGRFSAAMAGLSRGAAEAADVAPEAAWEVLSIAAAVGYQSGSRATQSQMHAVMRHLESAQEVITSAEQARSLWIESFLRPGLGTSARLDQLAKLTAEGPTDEAVLSRLAGAAWLDDESETASELAESVYHRLYEQGSNAAAANVGPIRSWTAWDMGRWDDALEFAAHASVVAAAAGGGMLLTTDDAVAALVFAVRGDPVQAEARVQAALALIQGEECLIIEARVHQARGLNAMSSGRFAEAYALLSRLFREDGTPLHFHISYFGIGDLAAAALRSNHLDEARTLLRYVLAQLPEQPAIRIQHLLLRAQALLAENDDDAGRFFEKAHSDASGSRWPFERGELLLDYGAWLRRRRRVGEAKGLLAQARDLFERLGAVSWMERAEAELRASHVDVPRATGSLDELTGQQREIVLLAAQGLTNREIAARLYLSPRTVSSHLYRSFPKLGIRDRWQLRDIVDQGRAPSIDHVRPPQSDDRTSRMQSPHAL